MKKLLIGRLFLNHLLKIKMDLKTYLELMEIQFQDFAKKIEVTPCTISNYIHGRRKPRLEIALKIERATKGRVTVDDLLTTWINKNKKSKK